MLMTRIDSVISAAGDGKQDDDGTGLGVATRTRTRTKTPSPYKVLMLNDDYTPMEFVVQVLQIFFKMNIEDATRVMLAVHQRGVGVCGIFSYEVAESSKLSETVLKLAGDVAQPIASRYSVAAEKAKAVTAF